MNEPPKGDDGMVVVFVLFIMTMIILFIAGSWLVIYKGFTLFQKLILVLLVAILIKK